MTNKIKKEDNSDEWIIHKNPDSDEPVSLSIKILDHQVDVKCKKSELDELLSKSFNYISAYKQSINDGQGTNPVQLAGSPQEKVADDVPNISIDKKETTSSILEKIFKSSWATNPRTMDETLTALKSLNMHYPKSTVAVNLARMTKSGVLRRFKKGNIYQYVKK